MAQSIRALAVLAEDLSLVPSTHMEMQSSGSRGSGTLFWFSQAPNLHVVYIHTFRQRT